MIEKLIFLYGEEKGRDLEQRLKKLIDEVKTKIVCQDRSFWDEKDIFLITYPDSFQEIDSGQARMTISVTLKTLSKFLDVHLKGVINGVHILPFYPYSSDRGFSITDYYQVKKEFGSWNDIADIGKNYRLMADLVLNHVSVKHAWFQKFLVGDERYWDYFIHFDKSEIPEEELKRVVRPRASPLLTKFITKKGERWVWTTFSVEDSTDQVDLNYKNPQVLLELIKVIFFLLDKGIRVFRLDAAPFVWKEIGTNCWNLPQTHILISLIRGTLDKICPQALLIAQSSTSFEENISYFGKDKKETHLIYNFGLPPLVFDAFYRQSNMHLNYLAEKMKAPRADCTFFNILAVHDGISTSGAGGMLTEKELEEIFRKVESSGGMLSYRNLPNGKKAVVEMNSTWWSALNSNEAEPFELQLEKFITSHAIAFSLVGIPAVYYLSLFGQQNDLLLFVQTKIKRDINRTNLDLRSLDFKLKKSSSKEARVFDAIINLIKKRQSLKSFHPDTKQDILYLDKRVFALLRGEKEKQILALHNLSDAKVKVQYQGKTYLLEAYSFIWQEL